MLDRSTAPPFIKSDNFELPGFKSGDVNGIPLFLIPEVRQDVLKIELMFPAGKWYEPKAGVSHFTSNMLEKGTQRLNSSELAEMFDRFGAHIEISAGYDNTSVSLYALRKNWKEVAEMLAEMIQTPAFDNEELDLMKDIFLQNLKVNREKTSFVVSQVIRKNIYGNHPYGTSLEEKDIMELRPEQLRSFHAASFSPSAIFVTTHPSVTMEEVSKRFGLFVKAAGDKSPSPVMTEGQKNEHVPKEGVQTSLRLGRRTLMRTDAGYPDLLLFNQILGGYFGSRLMKNIREEKGLTYGIYSSINPLVHDSFFVIGADVNKDNRDLALEEIRKEIKRMRTEPVDGEELEIARNHFLGSLQSEVANPFSVTDKIKNIYLHRLPKNYYPNLFSRINSITPQDLLDVGERYVHEDSMFTATVG
ncbi:MAG TPA: pitrilysin family protein [Cyclobacteriaceae bacterium]|nr:pitrilysin family protein [Cyclobacteriaceae bacterium]